MTDSIGYDLIHLIKQEADYLGSQHVEEQPKHLYTLDILIKVARLKLK